MSIFKGLRSQISWGGTKGKPKQAVQINPFTTMAFAFLKRFSVYIRPVSFRDSIFNVTINSAAFLKHPWLKFTGNVIVTLPFPFVDLQLRLKFGVSTIFGKFTAIFHL